jgi:hypothetical protein
LIDNKLEKIMSRFQTTVQAAKNFCADHKLGIGVSAAAIGAGLLATAHLVSGRAALAVAGTAAAIIGGGTGLGFIACRNSSAGYLGYFNEAWDRANIDVHVSKVNLKNQATIDSLRSVLKSISQKDRENLCNYIRNLISNGTPLEEIQSTLDGIAKLPESERGESIYLLTDLGFAGKAAVGVVNILKRVPENERKEVANQIKALGLRSQDLPSLISLLKNQNLMLQKPKLFLDFLSQANALNVPAQIKCGSYEILVSIPFSERSSFINLANELIRNAMTGEQIQNLLHILKSFPSGNREQFVNAVKQSVSNDDNFYEMIEILGSNKVKDAKKLLQFAKEINKEISEDQFSETSTRNKSDLFKISVDVIENYKTVENFTTYTNHVMPLHFSELKQQGFETLAKSSLSQQRLIEKFNLWWMSDEETITFWKSVNQIPGDVIDKWFRDDFVNQLSNVVNGKLTATQWGIVMQFLANNPELKEKTLNAISNQLDEFAKKKDLEFESAIEKLSKAPIPKNNFVVPTRSFAKVREEYLRGKNPGADQNPFVQTNAAIVNNNNSPLKEAPQNFWSERATIAERQGASENENYEAKLTQPDSKFVAEFGIEYPLPPDRLVLPPPNMIKAQHQVAELDEQQLNQLRQLPEAMNNPAHDLPPDYLPPDLPSLENQLNQLRQLPEPMNNPAHDLPPDYLPPDLPPLENQPQQAGRLARLWSYIKK